MYLVDTNVISEIRKISLGRADPHVTRWASATPSGDQFISVITVHEIEKGIRALALRDKARSRLLEQWLEGSVLRVFSGRVLPIDERIARVAGGLPSP